MSDRGFITPPPGLLPEPPAPREPDETTGGTAPAVNPPVFFPAAPGTPPVPPAPRQPDPEPVAPVAPSPTEVEVPSEPAAPARIVVTVGEETTVLDRDLYLGRAPVVPDSRRQARALPIAGEGTVSKTHAVLRPVADGIEIEDLGSTNGTAVTIGGELRLLAPREPREFPLPATIRLGDAVVDVRVERA